jgi:vanillate O-demethylase ferredoxin subunit
MKTAQIWTEARVHALRDVTPTVREITLKPINGALPHQAGGHLQMQVLVRQGSQGANSRPHTRSYSLIGQPDALLYRIAVKRLDEGRGGSKAMWQLAVGDRLQISEPQNHFPLDLAAPAYLLVAGGIGVTPLVGMAQLLAPQCAQRGATVQMLFGARSEAELAYLETLKSVFKGDLKTVIADKGEYLDFEAEIAPLPPKAQMYICGPVPMLDAARKAWAKAGRPLADLRYETFGSSGRFAPQAFRVKIPRHNLDITVSADNGLLDELEMAGVQAMYDCRRGECGLCAMDVLSVNGEIDHRDVFLSDEEKASNKRICVCVSRVVGEITLDSAYRAD